MNNRVRIVIVGDSGVGKTCLTHLIAHNESLMRQDLNLYGHIEWTVGCNIQIKIHEFKEGTARQCPYFVELFDVGGSLSHKNTRNVFYTGVHGIILVHDLTNGKSQEQLLDWLFEIVNKEGKDTYKSRATSRPPSPLPNYATDARMHFDLEEFLGATQTPILVMGTKLDLIDEKRQLKTAVKKSGGIADKCGAEEIWLNCRDTRSLAAGTTDAVKLSRFFDCVIEKRESVGTMNTHAFPGLGGAADRRRGAPTLISSSMPASPEFLLYSPKIETNSNVPLLETSDLK